MPELPPLPPRARRCPVCRRPLLRSEGRPYVSQAGRRMVLRSWVHLPPSPFKRDPGAHTPCTTLRTEAEDQEKGPNRA
jgi:hypothetical protein